MHRPAVEWRNSVGQLARRLDLTPNRRQSAQRCKSQPSDTIYVRSRIKGESGHECESSSHRLWIAKVVGASDKCTCLQFPRPIDLARGIVSARRIEVLESLCLMKPSRINRSLCMLAYSTNESRRRMQEFWLGLDRKSCRASQRTSDSCVCGRGSSTATTL